jgi:transcriptional regulator with XRE-family HTH domain
LSQLDLANEAGVSARHLSFVETGRSTPSPELLLTLAHHLDVPLREQNDLLLAAGYAPRHRERPLDDPSMSQVDAALSTLLERHDPYPGIVLDRGWNIVLANAAASMLADLVPPELTGPPMNLFRMSLHPDGLAAYTRNFEAWAGYLVRQLGRLVRTTADPALVALQEEILAYETVADLPNEALAAAEVNAAALLPCEMSVGGIDLSLITTLTTFGSPLDITLDELMIELFYPADDASDAALRELAG